MAPEGPVQRWFDDVLLLPLPCQPRDLPSRAFGVRAGIRAACADELMTKPAKRRSALLGLMAAIGCGSSGQTSRDGMAGSDGAGAMDTSTSPDGGVSPD